MRPILVISIVTVFAVFAIPISSVDANDWHQYGRRAFGIAPMTAAWDWLFSGSWAYIDNTPAGAARRILHFLEQGLPIDAFEQRKGLAPYLFKGTA